MRRIMIVATVMALLGSAMAGTAMAGRAGKTPAGVNPHFILDETGVGVGDAQWGDLNFYFKVAGLGKNGAADIEARGWLTLTVGCLYTRGNNTDRVVEPRPRERRVNVKTEYGDSAGYAIGTRALSGRGACSRNGSVAWVYGVWDDIQVAIYVNGSELTNETRTLNSNLCYSTDFASVPGFNPPTCP